MATGKPDRKVDGDVRHWVDAGTIEAGKLADLIIVEGNPLENVANAHKVRRVIFNG